MDKHLCCCIPDQTKLDEGCQNLAEYQIIMGDNPTPDDYTESCAEHLEEMLDDSEKFTVLRIDQVCLSCGHGASWHGATNLDGHCYFGSACVCRKSEQEVLSQFAFDAAPRNRPEKEGEK
jgi:hypothetical protein